MEKKTCKKVLSVCLIIICFSIWFLRFWNWDYTCLVGALLSTIAIKKEIDRWKKQKRNLGEVIRLGFTLVLDI